jgi:hypothetical protein
MHDQPRPVRGGAADVDLIGQAGGSSAGAHDHVADRAGPTVRTPGQALLKLAARRSRTYVGPSLRGRPSRAGRSDSGIAQAMELLQQSDSVLESCVRHRHTLTA